MQPRDQLKRSPAYQAGKSIAFSTACQKGHIGFTPSITDRRDWGSDWAAFMAGWREGLREYSKR